MRAIDFCSSLVDNQILGTINSEQTVQGLRDKFSNAKEKKDSLKERSQKEGF